jgi:hypothetical protein
MIYTALELGGHMQVHGQPKEGDHNVWIPFLFFIIIYALLIAGGFFS